MAFAFLLVVAVSLVATTTSTSHATHSNLELINEVQALRNELFQLKRNLQNLPLYGTAHRNLHEGHDHDHAVPSVNNHSMKSSNASHMEGMMNVFVNTKSTSILFEGWTTTTWAEYIGSCIAIILMSFVYSAITSLRRTYPNWKLVTLKEKGSSKEGNLADKLINEDDMAFKRQRFIDNSVKTLLFGIGGTLGYWIMLVVMTFNVGIFVSAILGLTIGYACFGVQHESNHSRRATLQ